MKLIIALFLLTSFLWSAVDINSASIEELRSLKGIGNVKAKAIVAYREKNCFKSVDELVEVKGIGKKTLKKNLSNLSVSECDK